jgi:hypothetical protein
MIIIGAQIFGQSITIGVQLFSQSVEHAQPPHGAAPTWTLAQQQSVP